MPIIPIVGKSVTGSTVSAKLSIKRCMFIRHIESSAFFCRSAAKIEDDYLGKSFSDLPPEIDVAYNSYVNGAILISVVFLENLINYYISNLLYNPGYAFTKLNIKDNSDINIVNAVDWKPQKCIYPIIEKYQMTLPSGKLLYKQNKIRPAILNKYQLFLGLANKQLLDENDTLFKDVQYLIDLRNELAHYDAKWATQNNQGDHDYQITKGRDLNNIVKYLKGKFPPNPFKTKHGFEYFPDECLGYGCAKWSFDNTKNFTDKFISIIGESVMYDNNKIRTK